MTVKQQTRELEHCSELLPATQGICLLLKGVFDKSFCQQLLSEANAQGFGGADQKYPKSYRNNDRLQLDEPSLANKLFTKCQPHIPKMLNKEDRKLSLASLNSRLRYCRYSAGQRFSIHQDGVYHQDNKHRSVLTFLLYLNDSDDYLGGETAFYHDQYGHRLAAKHKPCVGDVLVFEHDIWHSGDVVTQNSKYILRSDFIYRDWSVASPMSKPHQGYIWKIIKLPNNRLATASRDKSIKIWSQTLELQQTLVIHHGSVLDMSVSEEGHIYAVSRDGRMSLWSLEEEQYQLSFCIETAHPCVLSVRVLNDGRVVTTGSDSTLALWNNNGKLLARSRVCSDWHWQTLVSTNNELLSCSADGRIYRWQLDDLSLLDSTDLAMGAVRCMTLDKTVLSVGFESGIIAKLNLADFTSIGHWQAHNGIVRTILSSGGILYSGGEDNKVCAFDDAGCEQKTWECHTSFVTSLAFAGQALYSAAYDGRICRRELE